MGLALAAAARDAGIRLTLLDTLYLHGGLDAGAAGGYSPLRPEQARFSDGSAERWTERAENLAAAASGPEVRVGAAVHSVRAVDPASVEVAVDWTRDRSAPLHFHASEQPAENEQCLAVHGRTPVEVIAQAGGLGPDTTLVHATHITEHDRALIGEAGTLCCFCPTTEHDLADGVGPAEALARSGVRLCVGSDSHAVIDLLSKRSERSSSTSGPSPVTGACSPPRTWPRWPRPAATGHSAGPTAAPWRRAPWLISPR